MIDDTFSRRFCCSFSSTSLGIARVTSSPTCKSVGHLLLATSTNLSPSLRRLTTKTTHSVFNPELRFLTTSSPNSVKLTIVVRRLLKFLIVF